MSCPGDVVGMWRRHNPASVPGSHRSTKIGKWNEREVIIYRARADVYYHCKLFIYSS